MDKVKKLISEELNTVENGIKSLSFPNNSVFNELYNFANTKSKRIRSIFALLYLKACDVEIKSEIIDILIAGELIHNASLLHDDVIDDADLRRGQTTLSKAFSPKISILCGDYLLSFAINNLIKINNDKIFDLFQNSIKKMCESEISQFLLRGDITTLDNYLDICEGKTAALFVAMLESCALVSNIDTNQAKDIANKFGTFFQLLNDNDVFSAAADEKNEINTLNKIIGVEKTLILMDNYQKDLKRELQTLPNNIYKEELMKLLEKINEQRKI